MKWLKSNLPVLIVLVAGILASRTLLFQKGYFNMHDDLQMMRQLSMEKCFLDGQIPCRWVPDMGYGYGFPLFNFYPPLPYLVGEVFRVLGFSFVATVKLTFALSIILSGLAMYFLAKEFFGKSGGVVSAIFYIWAPYHAVDVYVRGAMNESWALVFFPLIFLFSYRLIYLAGVKAHPRGEVLLLALSYTGLLLSHNLMVLIFTPVFLAWCALWLWRLKPKNLAFVIWNLALSGITALGLSAFFTIPAIFENGYTWIKSQLIGYYDYTAHFVSLKQLLISRFWGYGPSVWMEADDKMSFQIGHVHWLLSLIIGGWWLVASLRKKRPLIHNSLFLIPFLFFVGWLAAFMTHVRSTPIYQIFTFLDLVQFPWRFLTIVIFAFSFLAGAIVFWLKNKFAYLFICLFIIGFNWAYFLPEGGKMGKLTDAEKFSGAAWDLQQTAGIYDYLPLTAKEAPKSPQKVLAEIMEGGGEISEMKQGTNWAEFSVTSDQSSVIRINILKFPGWRVWVDGKEVEIKIPEEEKWGRMWLDVPAGEHLISAKFTNTPVRTVSNLVSVLAWGFLLLQFRQWKKVSVWKQSKKGR